MAGESTTILRTDNWLITASIDGGAPIVFDTCKGGDNDSTTQNYRPGGMAPLRVLGGQSTVSALTLDKAIEMETDLGVITQLLKASIGRSRVNVTRQPLDYNGLPYGTPWVYNGILKQVLPGDTDSNKADAQIWSIVVVPSGTIG